MKTLSIVWYKVLPARFGGQKGIALFNKYLAEHFPLICLCSKNNKEETDLNYRLLPQLPVSKFQFLNPAIWKKIRETAMEEKPTHIILEHPYHGIAAIKACQASGARLIVHSHNIEGRRFREIGKWWWRLIANYERWVHRKADLSLFKSENEKVYAINKFGLDENKCLVVPYGVEPANTPPDKQIARPIICRRHSIPENDKILLFSATLDYGPNAQAVVDIYEKIAPILDKQPLPFKIIICGRNKAKGFEHLKNLTHPVVVNAGEVEDIENYLAASDAVIDPVMTGGGVQTKIIDALSASINVVCFKNMIDQTLVSVASSKLFITDPGNYKEFTELIKYAAESKSKTPDAFFEYYNWKEIAARVAERIKAI